MLMRMMIFVDSGVSMAIKMPSPTLKKECAAILESMKVSPFFFYIAADFFANMLCALC